MLLSTTFIRKSCFFFNNVEKYDTARQVTGGDIIQRMCFVCRMTKARDTHTQNMYVYLAYFFPTATMVMRTLRNVTLYTHSLSYFLFTIQRDSPQ
jgi:hypothetical protein